MGTTMGPRIGTGIVTGSTNKVPARVMETT
jgi:hypothetical protein